MQLHRREFFRAAAAAALSASCLAAAACGSAHGTGAGSAASSVAATSSTSAVPSASSTHDPLDGLTATEIAGKAFGNFKAATSMKWDGTLTTQDGVAHISAAETFQSEVVIGDGTYPGALKGCAGTIRFTRSDGSEDLGGYRFVMMPRSVYVRPDAAYWSATSGFGSGKSYSIIAGRYVQFPLSDHPEVAPQVAMYCDRMTYLPSLNIFGTGTKDAVTTLNGVQVVPITDSAIDPHKPAMYVTDTSKPQAVRLTLYLPDGSLNGQFTFSVGATVTVTVPPPSQVFPAAKLREFLPFSGKSLRERVVHLQFARHVTL